MADIKPFKGIRPKPGLEEKIASPPYDVLNSEEARNMAEGNEFSFLHINKPEIDLSPDVDIYSDSVYETGKKNFNTFLDKGYLIQDETPNFYVYRLSMNIEQKIHTQTGLVVGASVEEYEKGLIKKHEFTRIAKEKDRTRHVMTLNAHAGPVFLTYKSMEHINELIEESCINKPIYDFMAQDGVTHTLWLISDKSTQEKIVQAFKAVSCLYIADGHHRCASACSAAKHRRTVDKGNNPGAEYNEFLAVLFPHDQMKILDYNRFIRDLNGLSEKEFLEKISDSFECCKTENKKPAKEHSFGMYLGDRWYELQAKAEILNSDDAAEKLDVSILQQYLLSPILGIGDPRVDERIDFIGGIRGTAELEKRVNKEGGVAFSLFPTPLEMLFKIADNNQVMPPKSTWFEPKLRSGLIIKTLG